MKITDKLFVFLLIMLSNTVQVLAAPQNAPLYYQPAPFHAETVQTDVCIYGGTSAGIAAALQLARLNHKVVIVAPEQHIGGLSAGGLGETDIGNKAAIGGIAREFYQRVGQKYGVPEEWRFEPHIAAQVFEDMVQEAKAPLYRGQFLASVEKTDARIISLTTQSGLTVRAKMFIDATYEGDLMARAGVSYFVGREANEVYGEKNNGVQVHSAHQFDLPVDPYLVAGDPKSGLLPGVNPALTEPSGSGDQRVQAYNFRLCLTNDPANRISYEKPDGYDAREYELLARYLQAGWPAAQVFQKFDPIHNSFSALPDTKSTLLQLDDVRDERAFLVKLRNAGGPLTKYLKEQFSSALRTALDGFDDTQTPTLELQNAVVGELNNLLSGALLYAPERFAKVNLNAPTRALLEQNLAGDELLRLNRSLLEQSYPDELGRRSFRKSIRIIMARFRPISSGAITLIPKPIIRRVSRFFKLM